jgi:hypothetical protein
LTVVLLQKFAEAAAKLIPQSEVIDYAHDDKIEGSSARPYVDGPCLRFARYRRWLACTAVSIPCSIWPPDRDRARKRRNACLGRRITATSIEHRHWRTDAGAAEARGASGVRSQSTTLREC